MRFNNLTNGIFVESVKRMINESIQLAMTDLEGERCQGPSKPCDVSLNWKSVVPAIPAPLLAHERPGRFRQPAL